MNVKSIVFKSPTLGKIKFCDVVKRINDYMLTNPKDTYHITVGTDSQTDHETRMVLVICVQREGKGGIFFSYTEYLKPIKDLRSKIYYETNLSIEVAKVLNEEIFNNNLNYTFSIHADIGKNGPTAKLINEIVGWVTAEGYDCQIKPYSFAASAVANKITK